MGFRSTLLNEAVAALPEIGEDIKAYLDVFDHSAAGKNNKYDFFKEVNGEGEGEDDEDGGEGEGGKYEAIMEHKMV